ncbi:DUF1080 domain-containing protein [bacterium]|nr:DUF1080 domain-containing protein [bacterium]
MFRPQRVPPYGTDAILRSAGILPARVGGVSPPRFAQRPATDRNVWAGCPHASRRDAGATPHKTAPWSFLFAAILSCAVGLAPALEVHMIERTPPEGAVVLFDGTDLSAWKTFRGEPAPWIVKDGVATATKTNIYTRQEFGDCTLHLEFWLPPAAATDVFNGNSGVYLCGRYEVQIMNTAAMVPATTQACGAVYAVKPPTPNAALPAGQWQSFDIDFTAPRLSPGGALVAKPRISVIHNGVQVQDNVEIPLVQTGSGIADTYAERGPVFLQFHGHPVRFRNIWIIPREKQGSP